MAVLVTAGTIAETNDTSNVTTHASGSFTPVANRLYLLAVSHSDTAPEATVPTIATTTGLNFVQVGSSIAYDTTASNVHRLTLFRAMKASGLSAGTYTVTLADADTGAASTLIEVTQVVTTGTDGADAVINVSTNAVDAGANPSITMGAFSSNNNGVAAFFGFDVQTAATASNTGWTVVGDASYATPATGVTALWTGANAANAVCTHTSADWAGIAVELVSEAVPTIQPPQPPDPPKRKAALAAAILAGSFFFSPLPIPTPDVIDGSTGAQNGSGRLAPTVVQYQGHAGPIYVPDVTRVVPPLSWKPTYPDRLRPPPGLPAAAQQAYAADKFDPPTPVTTLTGWLATAPDLIRRRPLPERERVSAPAFVPDVTQPVTALSWAPIYPDRGIRAKRLTDAPQAVAPLHVPDVTDPVTALAWRGAYPDRLTSKRLVAERATVQPIDPPAAAQQTPDLAVAVYPSALVRTSARAHLSASQAEFGYSIAVVVPDLSWLRLQPDAVVRAKRLTETPQPVAPLFVPDVTQPVTARSWAPTYPDRVPGAVRLLVALQQPVTADTLTTPGAITVPAQWTPVYPAFVARRTFHPSRLPAADARDRFDPPTPPVVTPLSWKAIYPDRIDRKPTRGPAMLPFRADLSPTAHTQAAHYINPHALNVPLRRLAVVPVRASVQGPPRRTVAVPSRVRWSVPIRRLLTMALTVGSYTKAPSDTLYATVNFAPDLPDAVTLSSATSTVVSGGAGITISATSNDTTTATPHVTGGKAGQTYGVDVAGTYSDGQVRTFRLSIIVV